jgi:glycosyltransferase involved in cell wall biosynthesis
MRVLHIQKSTGIGGSERHLVQLLRGLKASGDTVGICVLTAGNYRRFVHALEEATITTTRVVAGHHVNPVLPIRLIRKIRAFAPDLVHTHLIHGDLYGQLAAHVARVPAVSTLHSVHKFYRREPYRSALRAAHRRAGRTIAISDHVARFIREAGILNVEGAIHVIPYGVDIIGPVSETTRERSRRSFKLGRADIVVGIASRLIPGKGHAVLLDAFATAAERDPRLRLLIAGDGPLRSRLEGYAVQRIGAGRVRFLGFVRDIESFMAACDLLVFPTLPELGEGFGLAALEAMAVGRPIVATAVASIPEIVVHEETGLLIEPADPVQLSDGMVILAQDPGLRMRMGRSAAERARDSFSANRMIEATRAVYEEVCAIWDVKHRA